MNFKYVLTLSAHTDDIEIAAGGTIARLIEEGHRVSHIAFSSVGPSSGECIKSMNTLGIDDYRILDFRPLHFPDRRQEIQQLLYDYNVQNEVDLVLCPSTQDTQQDHHVISQETIRAFRKSTILGHVFPWNHLVKPENCIFKLEKRHIEKKIEALKNYQSQHERGRRYMDDQYLRSLASTVGIRAGFEYAETFEVIQLIYGDLVGEV